MTTRKPKGDVDLAALSDGRYPSLRRLTPLPAGMTARQRLDALASVAGATIAQAEDLRKQHDRVTGRTAAYVACLRRLAWLSDAAVAPLPPEAPPALDVRELRAAVEEARRDVARAIGELPASVAFGGDPCAGATPERRAAILVEERDSFVDHLARALDSLECASQALEGAEAAAWRLARGDR